MLLPLIWLGVLIGLFGALAFAELARGTFAGVHGHNPATYADAVVLVICGLLAWSGWSVRAASTAPTIARQSQ